MSLVATGVVVRQQTLSVAVWLEGVGRVVGSFPNTLAGVAQVIEQLEAVRNETRADGVHIVLEPHNGAELPLIEAADRRNWPLTTVNRAIFARWAAELGYERRDGAAGAIQVARYAATVVPSQHDERLTQLETRDAPHVSNVLNALRTLPLAAYGAVGLILFVRLFQLDTLPGDLYGDIAIILDYVSGIFRGEWPMDFELSAGPLYHYLIAPLLWWSGMTYYNVKIASVVTSLITLGFIYALGRDLLDKSLGLMAFVCAGVSCWFLIFSRLGNSQILVPLLAVGSVYLALRAVRHHKASFLVASALMAAGGLYTYPQSFIFPGVTGLVLLWLIWMEPRRPWRYLWIYVAICVLGAISFMALVYRDLNSFSSGYIGGKLPTGSDWDVVLRQNIWNTLLSLHVRGDITFRSNPRSLPHLDVVSGLLFLVGLIFWLLPQQRKFAPVVLLPLLLLHLPSILVRYTVEVPSASRTLGAAPFIYIVVAGGLWWVGTWLRRVPAIHYATLVVILTAVLALNSYRYFVVYANGLPNHNLAFGRVITTYIDGLPADRSVVVIGCCWGGSGQPHPDAIQYDLHVHRTLVLVPAEKATCAQLVEMPRPATVIWGTANNLAFPTPQLAPCMEHLARTLHTAVSGERIFQSADLSP